ncbi:hypothetical protein JCM3770_005985 [Rhodotorula araucariae]
MASAAPVVVTPAVPPPLHDPAPPAAAPPAPPAASPSPSPGTSSRRPPSRPPSLALSRPPSTYRTRSSSSASHLSHARSASASSDSKPPDTARRHSGRAPPPSPHPAPLIIRDYAYPATDPRFQGRQLPEDAEAERERERRFRASDQERADEAQGLAGRVGAQGAGSGFHWGFVTSHSSDFPPSSDLSDNSSASSSPPDAYAFEDADGDAAAANWPPDGDGDGDGVYDLDLDLGEFVPGVYAALYAFEPELDTEMRLEAGDMVTVFERQCAGWVQAGRIIDASLTGEVGLVPENYLELVEAHLGGVEPSDTAWTGETERDEGAAERQGVDDAAAPGEREEKKAPAGDDEPAANKEVYGDSVAAQRAGATTPPRGDDEG